MSGLLNKREKYVAAEVYIPKDQDLYEALKQNKTEIEKEFGEPLDWQDLDIAKLVGLRFLNTILISKIMINGKVILIG